METKKSLTNSLSAVSLLALGVIWLIHVCAGVQLSPTVASGISKATAVIIGVMYVLFFLADFRELPFWLVIFFLFAGVCMIPAIVCALIDLFATIPDWAWLSYVLLISQSFGYLMFYAFAVYHACGTTESWIFRLLFIAIGLFLTFCVVVTWIPGLAEKIPVPLLVIDQV